jgi:hypothetical protein
VCDPTDPVRRLLFNVLAMALSLRRTRAAEDSGRDERRPRQRLTAGQSKLSPKQQVHLLALHGAVQHTIRELEEPFCVTRSTVCRAFPRDRSRAVS